ncbi:hypothetical protein PoB_007669600 [Plakobranchus ocellatus]|uniref:Uncharacterized protein n=1 Tax=Plakobranchus ocellatus TaxID=259542 RepID=A0AAV4E274_9GAST|nr:hypothetical protein PoB_007669600 [Plakobranchus ocellatus]
MNDIRRAADPQWQRKAQDQRKWKTSAESTYCSGWTKPPNSQTTIRSRQPGAELSQSLEKLDKFRTRHSVSYWVLYGAPQLRPWSSQPDVSRLDSEGVSKERYLRTGEEAPLKTMVEDFATQHQRIKKVSVLNVAHDLSKKYSVPTDRAPLPVPLWAPETAHPPPPPP